MTTTRKDSTMPSTPVRFFAVVGANIHSPGHPCDHDGCRATAAEFTVSCADDTGALVAGEVISVCAEHVAAQVRESCDS